MGSPLVIEPGDDVLRCSRCPSIRGRETVLGTGHLGYGTRLYVKCPKCRNIERFMAPKPATWCVIAPDPPADAPKPRAAGAA